MLAYSSQGRHAPTFVLMHYLGGSHRTWFPTVPYLDAHYRCVAIDTPGFGDSADAAVLDVQSFATQIDSAIRTLALTDVILVGHSMTGKIALAIAATQPDYLKGLVLVAPSPPTPQPATESDLKSQLAYAGTRAEAEQHVDTASANRLPDIIREVAIADAQAANLDTFHAWAEHGSQEDWSSRIGQLDYPALIVCGGKDDRVPSAQEQSQVTLPHLPRGRIHVIEGAGHLMPMEAPQALADVLLRFAATVLAGSDIAGDAGNANAVDMQAPPRPETTAAAPILATPGVGDETGPNASLNARSTADSNAGPDDGKDSGIGLGLG